MKYLRLFEFRKEDDFLTWLSMKLGKGIGQMLGKGSKGIVYQLSSGHAIKLSESSLHEQNRIMNKNIKGVAKIFSSGVIDIPKRFVEEDEHVKLRDDYKLPGDKKLYYIILEKITVTDDLLKALDDVDFAMDYFVDTEVVNSDWVPGEGWKEKIKRDKYGNIDYGLKFLFKNVANDKLLEKFIEYISDNKLKEASIDTIDILEMLADLIPMFTEISKYYNWTDIHTGQFGYNSKGELVAFDLGDSWYSNKRKEEQKMKINQPKTVIRESILRFKDF